MHLQTHKGVHKVIEEFQMSLKDAKLSEVSALLVHNPTLSLICCSHCLLQLHSLHLHCTNFSPPQMQMNLPLKLTYSEKLNKLESQYEKLLVSNALLILTCKMCAWCKYLCVLCITDCMSLCSYQRCSGQRQSHLESLKDFVSRATQELIWLNEKEEEEVAFDWSDRNGNISKKRDYHSVCRYGVI